MRTCENDKLINKNTPGIREFKFNISTEFTICADCMDSIYRALREIASLKINIGSYTLQKIDKDKIMMRIIIDSRVVQSKANLHAVKMILKNCNLKFDENEVLRAWLVNEGVGGYSLLINTVNKASAVKYSYSVDNSTVIIAVKCLKKAIKALNEMVCK